MRSSGILAGLCPNSVHFESHLSVDPGGHGGCPSAGAKRGWRWSFGECGGPRERHGANMDAAPNKWACGARESQGERSAAELKLPYIAGCDLDSRKRSPNRKRAQPEIWLGSFGSSREMRRSRRKVTDMCQLEGAFSSREPSARGSLQLEGAVQMPLTGVKLVPGPNVTAVSAPPAVGVLRSQKFPFVGS
jgi:hypothetical protein